MSIIKQPEIYDSPTYNNSHSSEYNKELYYYPFVVKSDSCVGSCFTVIDLLIKYMFQINKTKQKIKQKI